MRFIREHSLPFNALMPGLKADQTFRPQLSAKSSTVDGLLGRPVGDTVIAAVDDTARGGSVTNDAATTGPAGGCHSLDGAFETVEDPHRTVLGDGHRGVVTVPAGIAVNHDEPPDAHREEPEYQTPTPLTLRTPEQTVNAWTPQTPRAGLLSVRLIS